MPRTKEQFAQMRSDTRARLLAAASILFAKHGFSASSVADVAAEAGVATGLLYQHFAGKEELLAAIVAEAQRDLNALLDRLVSPRPPPDLQTFSCELIRALDTERPRWRMLLEALVQKRAMKAVPRVRLTFAGHLAAAIGRIDPAPREHPGLTREQLPAVVHALVMAWLSTEDAETPCAIAAALFRKRGKTSRRTRTGH